MNDDETFLDEYEQYEQLYNPVREIRKPRRAAVPTAIEELAEPSDSERGFPMTYQPARFEKGWLHSSLNDFYQQSLITDVLAHVKGGKEASVYCCQAHPNTKHTLLAAKVYRPRQFRNLRNDRMYREGRPILTADGRPVKATDTRLIRAVGKKTEFGVQVQHTSWLMYEYTTLERLYKAGAAVPQPISASENAILMGYQGDIHRAAPTLSEVNLETYEAASLFQETLRNIALLLEQEFVHGDLSAYNILYWEGKITLIDFPQVTHTRTNGNAYFILKRDITRVCDYFSHYGIACDPSALMDEFWTRYVNDTEE